ncbi:MAG: M20/M25/M40 family metallo-hydrolase [Bdellovibrionales bacterium]|nr:M20/M25/M40 family metallo-hydrolase [Bdellovibrionales bacterium]
MNLLVSLLLSGAFAHMPLGQFEQKAVLADATILRQLEIPIVMEDKKLNVGLSYINPQQEQDISKASHLLGRCGGFESLEGDSKNKVSHFEALSSLRQAADKEDFSHFLKESVVLNYNAQIADAMSEVDPANLEATVNWLSNNFNTRYHRSQNANAHVEALKAKILKMLEGSNLPFEVETVAHNSTPQRSLRVRLVGSEKPNEIIVLGGHLDSVVQGIFGPGPAEGRSPGSDDNASGSANILEALRILSTKAQSKRTIEFFWYAGEEAGLLGSAEIARTYKQSNQDVIAVLQLDMSLNPGAGEMVVGNTTDFTSLWLREMLQEMNRLYLNITLQEFACGYGCSDHASWFRQGYSTLMPFEATMNTINRRIHTKEDVVHSGSSFNHSAVFSKIAVGFAMELGNSDRR